MDDDDEDTIGWEDGNEDDEDIAWEDGEDEEMSHVDWEDGGGEGNKAEGTIVERSDDYEGGGQGWNSEDREEPEECRWLGENGEIVVELPRGDDDEGNDADGANGEVLVDIASKKDKGKEKSKPHRFTAEEIKQALSIHTVHLACLVSRSFLVSRWAGDPAVQAAMVSCLPTELVRESNRRPATQQGGGDSFASISSEGKGAAAAAAAASPSPLRGQWADNNGPPDQQRLQISLMALVVWFREFMTIVDDGAVGSGGDGSWGSRPARLLKVINQRVGCAQEAVQLFVALCRGLGLHARYVACLDPVPPHPRPPGPTKQTRTNTVDLAAADGGKERRRRGARGGARAGGGGGRRWGGGACDEGRNAISIQSSSRAWAEILCWKGDSLHVVAKPATAATTTADRTQTSLIPPPCPLKRRRVGLGKTLGIDEDVTEAGGRGCKTTPLLLSTSSDEDLVAKESPSIKRQKCANVGSRQHDSTTVTADGDEERPRANRRGRTRSAAAVKGRGGLGKESGAPDGMDAVENLGGVGTGRRQRKLSSLSSKPAAKTAMNATASTEEFNANKGTGSGKAIGSIVSSEDIHHVNSNDQAAALVVIAKTERSNRRTSTRTVAKQRKITATDYDRGRGGGSDRLAGDSCSGKRVDGTTTTRSNNNDDTGRSSRRRLRSEVKTEPSPPLAETSIMSMSSGVKRPVGSLVADVQTRDSSDLMAAAQESHIGAEPETRAVARTGVRAGEVLEGGSGLEGDRAWASTTNGVAVTAACDGGERWVHVDPIQGAVDQAEKVQAMRFRKRLMPYVVAADGNRRIVDVTRRYSSEWSRTLHVRGRAMAKPNGWWNRALRLWRALADGEGGNCKTGMCENARPSKTTGPTRAVEAIDHCVSEEKELQEKVDKETMPSTIAALKNHHVYVLAKSLRKFDGVRPGAKAAGLVKGCKVYLKSDVSKLRGASRWKQDGLQVKASELDKPAKVTTKKGEKDGEGTSKLYGEWQTEAWVPEGAVNGKVPKNEYGNVEFFNCSPAFLPPGTAHVRGDQIGRVATKLGVDYAPALTGFETKQGRQVPVLDGIIVCKEHAQILRDAHTTWEQTNLEKQAKARGQRVLRRWRILFQGVLLGANLLEEYGDHD